MNKPHIYKKGSFWWCRGKHKHTQRNITLHGTVPKEAWARYIVARQMGRC